MTVSILYRLYSLPYKMKMPYYTQKDKWIITIFLPPAILLINSLIFGNRYWMQPGLFMGATIISGAIGLFSWHLQIIVAVQMQQRYPAYHQTFRRITISILWYMLITTITIILVFTLYHSISWFQYQVSLSHLAWAVTTGIITDLLGASFHEGAAFYEKWKRMTDKAEQLKEENLQTQLDSLKGQVNPHFLFNSLNSLSSLISEDPLQAERFVDELSKVYRYLLRNNSDPLTSLASEMQFVQSYYHLLKTRYGNSLTLQTHIDPLYEHYLLPPLTLQMLIENAVKHNAMMKNQPLQITIMTTAGNRLVVTNNLQRKTRQVASNKVGLSNIARKYQLLKQADIEVFENTEAFSVIIPLIKE
ncbi:MAG: histidine kinase [Chitinophagaceae bacterium]